MHHVIEFTCHRTVRTTETVASLSLSLLLCPLLHLSLFLSLPPLLFLSLCSSFIPSACLWFFPEMKLQTVFEQWLTNSHPRSGRIWSDAKAALYCPLLVELHHCILLTTVWNPAFCFSMCRFCTLYKLFFALLLSFMLPLRSEWWWWWWWWPEILS